MAMSLEDRDKDVIRLIYTHGGILHRSQIKQFHWVGKSDRAITIRLTDILCAHNYLAHNIQILKRDEHGEVVKDAAGKVEYERNDDEEHPETKAYYWLGWRGAIWIAQELGHRISMPETCSEIEQNRLQKQLESLGIFWSPEPAWKRVEHDRMLADVQIAIEIATSKAGLKIEDWMHENFFRHQPTSYANYPDAYFAISDSTLHPGKAARFLLELDRATHNYSTLANKFKEGLALLRSASFRNISGSNIGMYAIVTDVTTNESRANGIIETIRNEFGEDAKLFLVTTIDQVKANDPLGPIWINVGRQQIRGLLEER